MNSVNHKCSLSKQDKKTNSKQRLIFFLCITIGNLAQWLWSVALPYLENPLTNLYLGSVFDITLRIIISLIISALIFLSTYTNAKKLYQEPWQIYFYAFGSGFMGQTIIDVFSNATA